MIDITIMNLPIIWASCIFFTVVLLVIVGSEIYRFTIQKKDRGFWSGSFTLLCILFFGLLCQISYETIQNQYFLRSIDNPEIGQLNKDYLRTLYPDSIYDYGCTLDKTEKSKQCLFIISAENNDKIMVTYVSDENKAVLRTGEWPFATTMTFPSVQKRQLEIWAKSKQQELEKAQDEE